MLSVIANVQYELLDIVICYSDCAIRTVGHCYLLIANVQYELLDIVICL